MSSEKEKKLFSTGWIVAIYSDSDPTDSVYVDATQRHPDKLFKYWRKQFVEFNQDSTRVKYSPIFELMLSNNDIETEILKKYTDLSPKKKLAKKELKEFQLYWKGLMLDNAILI